MTVYQLALTFFIITNPIGNSPAILALLQDYSFSDQRRILIREGLISFIIVIVFQYLGEIFLKMLRIQDYALSLCGGVLLLIIALEMIFPRRSQKSQNSPKLEPFIVPIATPLLAGAGVLSMVMLLGKQEANPLKVSLAIIIAWIGVMVVLACAPYMQKLLGKRGLLALEQLMGMLLAIIATDVLVKGIEMFIGAI